MIELLRAIDWPGLSVRVVRGWRRGTVCLAHCNEGHTYGPGCLLRAKTPRKVGGR